jgi:glycosyltransferase involved in cell wall biosynthesis
MRIAIFDYRVTARNPAGSCHLALLRALAHEHQFTVFAVEFDNPAPEQIDWVRVPVPKRPLALLFVAFHLVAPFLYGWYRLHKRGRFDLIQSVESNLGFGKLVYAHFSHTTYLKGRHPVSSGIRGWLRWLDHALHAIAETVRYRRASLIVVPSRGLERELRRDLKLTRTIEVISNPVAIENFDRPRPFDSPGFRRQLALEQSDVVCVFCALGHFERKGLPILLEALRSPTLSRVKLVVVGGEPDLVRTYRLRAAEMHIDSQTRFAGFQTDARPYLWSADAFVLPSAYETFSLVAYEAAAAGLPLIAPALNGISDLLVDGETGFLIEPHCRSVAIGLERLLQCSDAERRRMGANAKRAASYYSPERFADSWRGVYQAWTGTPRPISSAPEIRSDFHTERLSSRGASFHRWNDTRHDP